MQKTRSVSDNLICGLIAFLFFLSIFVQTINAKPDVVELPKVISILGMVSSVLTAALGAKEKRETTRESLLDFLIMLISTLVLGGAMLLAEYVGFYVMLLLIAVLLMLAIQYICNEKRGLFWLKALLIGLIFCGILYAVFGLILKINTPNGFLL